MSETNQERVHRLIAERDAAIHQLAEWFVRTGGEVYDVSLHHGNRFCFPYTIHELLDKAISDRQKPRSRPKSIDVSKTGRTQLNLRRNSEEN